MRSHDLQMQCIAVGLVTQCRRVYILLNVYVCTICMCVCVLWNLLLLLLHSCPCLQFSRHFGLQKVLSKCAAAVFIWRLHVTIVCLCICLLVTICVCVWLYVLLGMHTFNAYLSICLAVHLRFLLAFCAVTATFAMPCRFFICMCVCVNLYLVGLVHGVQMQHVSVFALILNLLRLLCVASKFWLLFWLIWIALYFCIHFILFKKKYYLKFKKRK